MPSVRRAVESIPRVSGQDLGLELEQERRESGAELGLELIEPRTKTAAIRIIYVTQRRAGHRRKENQSYRGHCADLQLRTMRVTWSIFIFVTLIVLICKAADDLLPRGFHEH